MPFRPSVLNGRHKGTAFVRRVQCPAVACHVSSPPADGSVRYEPHGRPRFCSEGVRKNLNTFRSLWQTLFCSALQCARSASNDYVHRIEVSPSDEACETRNRLIVFFASALKMRCNIADHAHLTQTRQNQARVADDRHRCFDGGLTSVVYAFVYFPQSRVESIPGSVCL